MQPSRNKPPAAPGTGHRDGCSCGACQRWRKAAIEAARLREFNLQKARLAKAGVSEGRKEAKREAAAEVIDRSVQHTDRRLADLHRVFENKDPRTDVFLALRAAGKSIADATAEVDRQFANDPEPINKGDDHG